MRRKSWLCLAGMLAGMVVPLIAGQFVPPAEGPVAFRRDRIPLDADAMGVLSRHLGELARGLNPNKAEESRAAAQALALALALDPANAKARGLLSELGGKGHEPGLNAGRLETSRAYVWQSIAWLDTQEAGPDAQALAACLKDVIVACDPKHPDADELRKGGEKGAWRGWVPDISAYGKKPADGEEGDPFASVPRVKPPVEVRIPLDHAEVMTPMWLASGSEESVQWDLGPAPLQMTARAAQDGDHGNPAFSLVIGSQRDYGALDQLADSVREFLRKQHGDLPRGLRVQVTSKEFQRSVQSGRRQSISAAVTVLASAAVTGREPDAIIIGQIDEDGSFKLPSRFWYQLKSLGKGNGKRLVLPAEAADYLPSILAMEKPEFFFEYEVLLAADFKQLLALTAKTPDEPLASAIAKFREIRDRAGGGDVRTYIVNTFVKQRLAAVLQDLPDHVSAKMLLIQASGERPAWVCRKVLAAELRRGLEPAAEIKSWGGYEAGKFANVGKIYETCRANVDALDRCTERQDRDLLDKARELLTAIRNLDRAVHSRGEEYVVADAIDTANSNLRRVRSSVDDKLAEETGDKSGSRSR